MAGRLDFVDYEVVRAFVVVCALFAIGCGGDLPPLAGDMAGAATGDMTLTGDMLLPFGAPCMVNAQCASNLCFVGGMMTFCSLPCTMATAAQDCPVPPTSGTCNMKGYCKP